MRLFLTTTSPSNAVYTDASGAPQYKVKTPFKVHNRTTAISRVIERGIPRRHSGSSAEGHEAEEESVRYANLANIDWRPFGSSVIHFRGQELAVRDFFRKEGLGWYGRLVYFYVHVNPLLMNILECRHRVFTALDGREFKWILSIFTSQASTI
jgi:hypothetical protein